MKTNQNIIKLTAVLLLAASLFFAGCDVGNDNIETDQTVVTNPGTNLNPGIETEAEQDESEQIVTEQIGTEQEGTEQDGTEQGGTEQDGTEQGELEQLPPPVKTLVSISVKAPTKTDYFINESIDLAGIEVTATYSDGSTEVVIPSLISVSGFNSSTPGEKPVTITYNGKSDTFKVTVLDITLIKIEITTVPAKTEYWFYESLNLNGLKVKATLSNGDTEFLDTDELTITGFDSNSVGTKTVTVSSAGKTATFTVEVKAQTFTVTFVNNGGDSEASPNTKTVTQPATTIDSLPTPPTKTGYYLDSWKDSGGNSFTTSYLVTSNITVYAQWEKQTYTVTFNSNGGSAIVSQSIKFEEKASKPATDPTVPAGSGKYITFGGWYKDNNTFNNKWDFTTNTVNSDIILYAKWRNYEIGDVGPGGGKIYYYDKDGFKLTGYASAGTYYYLEASPNDLGSVIWGANRYDIEDETGYTTEDEIGDGKFNTQILVNNFNNTEAAKLCASYTGNGFSDWFLPSADELYYLFLNRDTAGITLILGSTSIYWSSSEAYDDFQAQYAIAYYYSTSDNKITNAKRSRTNTSIVRPIRAF